MSRRFKNLIVILSLCFVGCKGGSDDSPSCVAEKIVCPAAVPDACDIRTDTCQRDILHAVACEREGTTELCLPPVRTITPEGYLAEALATLPSESEADEAWRRGLALVNLARRDSPLGQQAVEDFVANTVAFYSSGSNSVTIFDRGSAADSFQVNETLAHEYVHALQDAENDLGAFSASATTTDESIARGGVVEGEAQLYEFMYRKALLHNPFLVTNWEAYLARVRQRIADSTCPYWTARLSLRYPLGGRYVSDVWNIGSNPSVHALFKNPRKTLREMVGDTLTDSLPKALSCASPAAPPGFVAMTTDRFGMAETFALLTTSLSRPPSDEDLAGMWGTAAFWRGDRFTLFKRGELESIAIAWTVQFLGESEAADFALKIQDVALRSGWIVEKTGNEVTIAASEDVSVFPAWNLGCEG